MEIFDTPEPISVTIELGVVGDVRILASDRDDTVVEIRPRDESRAADVRAAEQTRVEFADGRLHVTAPRRWRQFSFVSNGGAVDLTIGLPTGSRLDGDLAMGRLDGEGRLGACRLKTAMGNIGLEQVGSLHLNTSYGDVTVDDVTGDADVTTGSGKVRIREVDGNAMIKNSNGDTTLGAVTGELRVKSANGDISVDRALASVTAKTANGSIRIGEVTRGSVGLDTACGDLEIGIREGTAAWLEVSSQYGRVRNSLDASDGPQTNDDTVEVRASTSYGDVVIRRSPAHKTA